MMQIPLTQGKSALIDDEDFEKVSQFKWYAHRHGNTYYVIRKLPRMRGKPRKDGYMHRMVLGTTEIIDHIDGNGLNNQKANLRITTTRGNLQNQRNRRNQKTSRFPGVTRHKKSGKWQTQIKFLGKNRYLGLFSDEHEAATVYNVACAVLSGAPS